MNTEIDDLVDELLESEAIKAAITRSKTNLLIAQAESCAF